MLVRVCFSFMVSQTMALYIELDKERAPVPAHTGPKDSLFDSAY